MGEIWEFVGENIGGLWQIIANKNIACTYSAMRYFLYEIVSALLREGGGFIYTKIITFTFI